MALLVYTVAGITHGLVDVMGICDTRKKFVYMIGDRVDLFETLRGPIFGGERLEEEVETTAFIFGNSGGLRSSVTTCVGITTVLTHALCNS